MRAGRNAAAAVAVLLGLAALVAVPAAIQAALPDEGPLPAGDRLDAGYGVTVRPPAGARLDLNDSRPGGGEVLLLAGRLSVRLTALSVPERRAEFVAHRRRKFSRDEGLRPGPAEPVRTAAGVVGERGTLTPDGGPADEPGCYGIFTAEQAGVVVVISPVSGCGAVPGGVWSSVASIEVEPVA